MRYLIILSLAAVIASTATSTRASTVTISSFGGPDFITTTGSLLDLGDLVKLGWLTNLADNETAIRNASEDDIFVNYFNEIADTSINDGGFFNVDGEIQQAIQNVNETGGPSVPATYQDGSGTTHPTKMVLMVYNAPTRGGATEFGLFMSSGPLWNVPSDPLIDPTMNTSMDVEALKGTGPGGDNTETGTLTLTVIPEPGAGILAVGGLGLLGLIRRRRTSAV